MKLKEIPISERPREKLLKYGKENLSDSELLAIILKTGTRKCNVNELAIKVIKELNGIENLKEISFNTLTNIKGIGETKAIELLTLSELSKRINKKEEKTKKIKYKTPKIIFENTKELFEGKKQEYFYCLYLNTKKELIERKLLFMGTLNRSIVHPREIFKEAYRVSASSIICVHNHPSGDVMPSQEDILLTSSLIKIGVLNAIPIIDHIIISEDKYFSFYEEGILKWKIIGITNS